MSYEPSSFTASAGLSRQLPSEPGSVQLAISDYRVQKLLSCGDYLCRDSDNNLYLLVQTTETVNTDLELPRTMLQP